MITPPAQVVAAAEKSLPRRAFVASIMTLPISVHVRGPLAGSSAVAALVGELYDAVQADEQMFSIWKPDSPVSRIRDGRDLLRDAHPRVRRVAALCELAGHRTGGSFSGWLPTPDGRLLFQPTGLVKGWSVEQAFSAFLGRLERLGPHDALVNAGGDIAVPAPAPTPRTGASRSRIRATAPGYCGLSSCAPGPWPCRGRPRVAGTSPTRRPGEPWNRWRPRPSSAPN